LFWLDLVGDFLSHLAAARRVSDYGPCRAGHATWRWADRM